MTLLNIDIPTTVTTSCPIKQFKQRYIHKGCMKCEYFKGIAMLTDADEMDVKDRVTGDITGKRPIQWHEKYMVRCAFPMTRRCSDMSIVDED